jgi:hypothetical protein
MNKNGLRGYSLNAAKPQLHDELARKAAEQMPALASPPPRLPVEILGRAQPLMQAGHGRRDSTDCFAQIFETCGVGDPHVAWPAER